jgi:hypothetical protein
VWDGVVVSKTLCVRGAGGAYVDTNCTLTSLCSLVRKVQGGRRGGEILLAPLSTVNSAVFHIVVLLFISFICNEFSKNGLTDWTEKLESNA